MPNSNSKLLKKYERKVVQQQPKASTVDRIRKYYFEQDSEQLNHDTMIVLTPEEKEAKRLYEEIFGLLIEEKTPLQVKKLLVERGVHDRTAYRRIKEAQELFCDVQEMKKEAIRVIQVEIRKRANQLIEDDDRLEAYDKYYLKHLNNLQIERLAGLHDPDRINLKELLDQLQMPDVTITDDPVALDVEHEEVDDE